MTRASPWAGINLPVRRREPQRRPRAPRPRPETIAARRTIAAELVRARRRPNLELDPRGFPLLCELLAKAEWQATFKPRQRELWFRGSPYRWRLTILDRVIVEHPDGRAVVASGPFVLVPDNCSDLRGPST